MPLAGVGDRKGCGVPPPAALAAAALAAAIVVAAVAVAAADVVVVVVAATVAAIAACWLSRVALKTISSSCDRLLASTARLISSSVSFKKGVR